MRAFERTGDASLLALARYFIEERGQRRPESESVPVSESEPVSVSRSKSESESESEGHYHYFDLEAKARGVPPRPGPGHGAPYSYHQADRPIREIASASVGVQGHAVRAMYVSVYSEYFPCVGLSRGSPVSCSAFGVLAGTGYLGQPASRASRATRTAR